jgi:hypothetical protein
LTSVGILLFAPLQESSLRLSPAPKCNASSTALEGLHPSPQPRNLRTHNSSINFLTADSSCDQDWKYQQRAHFDHSQRGHAKSCPQSRLRVDFFFTNHRPPDLTQHRARRAGSACRGHIPAILAAAAPPNFHPASLGPCLGNGEETWLAARANQRCASHRAGFSIWSRPGAQPAKND